MAFAEAQADRQLALGLAELWDRGLFRPLGFARATDFVREHLGLREGRARWLAKLGRGLRDVQELDRAFAVHRLNASQVVELRHLFKSAPMSSAERQSWIDWSTGRTVRAVHKAVADVLARNETGGPGNVDPTGETTTTAATTTAATTDGDRAGGWFSVTVPAHVAMLWHTARDLARRAAGRHLSQAECAEVIVAEFLSGAGDEPPAATAAFERARELEDRALEASAGSRAQADDYRRGFRVADDISTDEQRGTTWPGVDWSPPPGTLPEDCTVDGTPGEWNAFDLAVRLRRITEIKKEMRDALGEFLAELRHRRSWRELGFASFDEYCRERLGFSQSRARALIRFHEGLDRHPRLRRAFFEEELGYTATQDLLGIIHATTEEEWVEWALGLTYREIERAVEFASMYTIPDATPAQLAAFTRLRRLAASSRKVHAFAADQADTRVSVPEPGDASPGGARADGMQAENTHADDTHPDDAHPDDAHPDGMHEDDTHAFAAGTHAFATDTPPAFHPATNAQGRPVPSGYTLPPTRIGGLPRVPHLPVDILETPPDLAVARIRFWAPDEILEVLRRGIRRCRAILGGPPLDDGVYFEAIMVHFIRSQDTPATRAILKRHPILARDGFRCVCPGCTSRENLHGHHGQLRSQGGTDDVSNQEAMCAFHHHHGAHGTILEIGGHAPDGLVVKLGIDPRNGRALACYLNERRTTEEDADRRLADWRREWRIRLRRGPAPTDGSDGIDADRHR